ncbi:MAG: pyridoxal-phosphate dependent enzyme, partial [Pseudomonadota bacterium]|nr:pyridoxal-phosphate dependent enzyme [Pseudomonadota bacterium]
MKPHTPLTLEELQDAQDNIRGAVVRTPLVQLNVDVADTEIYLKLENLQPIGSFKLRGAINAIRNTDSKKLEAGVWTASMGNMAQGVAWAAREIGIKATVVVPDDATRSKLAAMEELGASIRKIPRDAWFDLILYSHDYPGMVGLFIHPASNRYVMAGQGTIGLEILEDLPDVNSVVTPFGGGGLTAGVASAIQLLKPTTRRYACELETGAPLAPSLAAGEPVTITTKPAPRYASGFSGAPSVAEEMWPILSSVVDDSLLMSVNELATTIRLLIERNHIVAEGAGAAAAATALAGRAGTGKIACVVSGGHIDLDELNQILSSVT